MVTLRNRTNAANSPPKPSKSESEANGSIENLDENEAASGGSSVGGGGGGRDRKNPEQVWADKLEALKKYKAKHGHTNVPKSEKFEKLGRFVNNQRQFYRRKLEGEANSLTDDRVRDLEALGFVWAMKPISENRSKNLQAQWEQRLRELREYKNEHGHCNVPVKGKDRELGKFVMNQRYYYKTRLKQRNSLTPERIRDLKDIGFVWTMKGRKDGDNFLTNEEKWERNIDELKKFKEKFGHVNVTKSGEYMELGQFVGNQRYFYRRRLKGESNSLTEDRIKKLSDLGFEWKVQNKWGEGGDSVDVSSKMKGGSQVVEVDKEITLPDGSTIDYTTKESSQKRLVVLEDGSNLVETTTKTYTTKVEKSIVPPQGAEEDADLNLDIQPAASSTGLDVFDSDYKVTFADGSSVTCTTEQSSHKRLIVLEDDSHMLEITTRITRTKVERSRLPEETVEMQPAEPCAAG